MSPFLYSVSLRILLTPVLFLTRQSIPLTVLALFILDSIDCNPLVIKLFEPEQRERQQYCSLDPVYERWDKALDIIQMAIAGWMLHSFGLLTDSSVLVFAVFLSYRALGLLQYWQSNDESAFIQFLDFGKEYLLLLWFFDGQIPFAYMILAILAKIGYEWLMHRYHIAIRAYQWVFE